MLEWRFHRLCDALGPGWRFNVDIHDEHGFVGRVDALHEATGTIVELDSRRFHGEDRFQTDRTRDQRLAALGFVVIRLTWDDVERRPMEIVERIRRTVAVRGAGSAHADPDKTRPEPAARSATRGLSAIRGKPLRTPSHPRTRSQSPRDSAAVSAAPDHGSIQDRSRREARELEEVAPGARELDESVILAAGAAGADRRGRTPRARPAARTSLIGTPAEGTHMGRLSVISDMDGVIYRGKELIPGAQDFVAHMRAHDIPFLFLTNNSEQTPLDLLRKLDGLGIHGLTEANFITSAIATAQFLHAQRPHSTAYVVGGSGLAAELYKVGYSITESDPEYVVVGKTATFNFATHAQGRAADRRRREVHRHQPGPDRPGRGRHRARGRRDPRRDRGRDRAEALHRRQAELADDDLRPADARGARRGLRDDRRPDGHRHRRRAGGRDAHLPGALRGLQPETIEQFPYRPNFVFDSVGSIDSARDRRPAPRTCRRGR